MKKIISLICVLTLVVSTMLSFGVIANAEEVITSSIEYDYYEDYEGTHYLYVTLKTNFPELSGLIETTAGRGYVYTGSALQTMDISIQEKTGNYVYDSFGSASADETFTKPTYNSTRNVVGVSYLGGANVKQWYKCAAGGPEFTICYEVKNDDVAPEFVLDDLSALQIANWNSVNADNKYTTLDYIVGGGEGKGTLALNVGEIPSYNEAMAPVEPEVPTAADLGLFTDASQNFKVTDKVMTSNGYSIEKALGFVSGIYADAAVVTYGTEITCEGFTKVLEIPAVNTYEAMENVKGFVAAVTSIRNDNLNKTFTAKAYADVTVGEETVRIYAEEAATAVYGN